MDGNMKAKIALNVKLGKAPKKELRDREVADLYYNNTVAALQGMIKKKPGRPKNGGNTRNRT